MPKQCPQCFQVYGDNAQFCNNDGTALPSPADDSSPVVKPNSKRRRSRRRQIMIPLTLAAIAIALGVGYYFYQRHLQSRVTVVLEEIRMPEDAQSAPDREKSGALGRVTRGILDAARIAAGAGDLIAQVKIENTASFPGSISSANYTLLSSDKELGRGAWSPSDGPQKFSPKQEIFLDLPFRLDARNTATSVLDALAGRASPVRLRGEMKIDVFGITYTIPFEARLVRPQSNAPERVYSN